MQNEEFKNTIFDHINKDSTQEYTLDFKSPGHLYLLDKNDEILEIAILRIELNSTQKTSHFQLQSGSFKEHEIAFGRSTDQNVLVTLVKHSAGKKMLISGIIEDEQGKRTLIGYGK